MDERKERLQCTHSPEAQLSPVLGLERSLQPPGPQPPLPLPLPCPGQEAHQSQQVTGSPTDLVPSIGPDVTFLQQGHQRHSWEAHVTQDIDRRKIRSAFIKSFPPPWDPSSLRISSLGRMPSLDGLAWVTVQDSLYIVSAKMERRKGDERRGKMLLPTQKGWVKTKNLSVDRPSLGPVSCHKMAVKSHLTATP